MMVDVRPDRIVLVLSAPMRASVVATLLVVAGMACTATPNQEATPSVTSPSAGSPTQSTPSLQPVTDYSSFIDGLEVSGHEVRQGERTGGDHLFGPGQSVFIDGTQVSTYEFPTERALDEFKASVSDDGYSIPTRGGGFAMVEWISPPTFHAAGKLLVLYFGDKQGTLDALELLMGRSFAGGTTS
jgi:hypothetical protein